MTRRFALFAPYLPAPAQSGGRIRIHRFARALAEIGEVHLFASSGLGDALRVRQHPDLDVYASVHTAAPWFALVPSRTRPARVRRASPWSLKRAFQREDARLRFDAAVVEHVHAASIPALGRPIPWILDEHNIESDFVRARSDSARCEARAPVDPDVVKLEVWQDRVWRAATHVVCVSEADARRITVARAEPPIVIPNGVATDEIPFTPPSHRTGHEILFVGTMGHAPNAAAARWLALEILPLVRRTEPRARLVLCGADPSAEVSSLQSPQVDVTGRVRSVAPYLERAAVVANPMRRGAGTSLKVLEALAGGAPLVSTRLGVRGYDLSPAHHYLQAEDSASFAAAIVGCLVERCSRDEAARRGRAFAERHDWTALSRRFVDVVERTAH